jgi:hypothetical protein
VLVGAFFAGNLIVGFAFNKESVPPRLAGTASGVCNMGPLMGGMLLATVMIAPQGFVIGIARTIGRLFRGRTNATTSSSGS